MVFYNLFDENIIYLSKQEKHRGKKKKRKSMALVLSRVWAIAISMSLFSVETILCLWNTFKHDNKSSHSEK